MTDNDIKKALECCSIDPNNRDCGKCPLVYTDMGCSIRLSKDALDLINRLQAKNTLLESINKELSKSVDMLKLYDISNLKAEIERLQKAIKVQDIMIEQQDYKLKQAKSEAIKEFAGKLKEKTYYIVADERGLLLERKVVNKETIDNLVKEMTEQ